MFAVTTQTQVFPNGRESGILPLTFLGLGKRGLALLCKEKNIRSKLE